MTKKQKEPEFIDPLEKQIYDLLTSALNREECAARAAARLEYDLVKQYQQDRTPPTDDSESVEIEVPNESRDFSTGQFQTLFGNLNTLRTTIDVATLLELPTGRIDEITDVMISGMFSKPQQHKSVGVGSSKPEERPLIGTDDEVMLERLREAAALRQRSKKRSQG